MLSLFFPLVGLMLVCSFWFIQVVILMGLSFLCLLVGSKMGWFVLGSGMGLDILSWVLVILSLWIGSLMFLGSNSVKEVDLDSGKFTLLVLFLVLFLSLAFFSLSFFGFYILFEAALIPIFLIILGWGVHEERLQSGLYMLFYTLLGSLPLLMGILSLKGGSLGLVLSEFVSFQGWGFILLMAFLIKLPIFFLHAWLPRAHVEAPVAGSMILAGVLLKLGGYGLYRFGVLFSFNLNSYLVSLGLLGGLWAGLSCFYQQDLKALVAYSSISHMGLYLGGFVSFEMVGFSGGILMMLGHGLCSSGLFCWVNFLYERFFTRSVLLLRGVGYFYPGFALTGFLLLSSNMAAPLTLGLMGEIMLAVGVLTWGWVSGIILLLLFFVVGGYSIYLYSVVTHGSGFYFWGAVDFLGREYLLVILHWVPLNLGVLFLSSFLLYDL